MELEFAERYAALLYWQLNCSNQIPGSSTYKITGGNLRCCCKECWVGIGIGYFSNGLSPIIHHQYKDFIKLAFRTLHNFHACMSKLVKGKLRLRIIVDITTWSCVFTGSFDSLFYKGVEIKFAVSNSKFVRFVIPDVFVKPIVILDSVFQEYTANDIGYSEISLLPSFLPLLRISKY